MSKVTKKKLVEKAAVKKPPVKKKPAAKKGGPGRGHTGYNPSFEKLAYWLARNGLIDTEIAKELGIAASTLYSWRDKHPEFAKALDAGKEHPDNLVEQALFKRAIGDKSPAGVTACIFWLKNRRPDRWKDMRDYKMKTEIQMQREEKVNNAIEKLTADPKLAGKFLPLLASVTGNGGPRGRGPSQN